MRSLTLRRDGTPAADFLAFITGILLGRIGTSIPQQPSMAAAQLGTVDRREPASRRSTIRHDEIDLRQNLKRELPAVFEERS